VRRQFRFLGELTEEGFISHDREEVRQALLDLEGAMHQLGGVLTISAVRQEVGPETFVTTGMVMTYDSYAPKIPVAEQEVEDGARVS
jgi:hypothetical protein